MFQQPERWVAPRPGRQGKAQITVDSPQQRWDHGSPLLTALDSHLPAVPKNTKADYSTGGPMNGVLKTLCPHPDRFSSSSQADCLYARMEAKPGKDGGWAGAFRLRGAPMSPGNLALSMSQTEPSSKPAANRPIIVRTLGCWLHGVNVY